MLGRSEGGREESQDVNEEMEKEGMLRGSYRRGLRDERAEGKGKDAGRKGREETDKEMKEERER